jgi:hypothetical protein
LAIFSRTRKRRITIGKTQKATPWEGFLRTEYLVLSTELVPVTTDPKGKASIFVA